MTQLSLSGLVRWKDNHFKSIALQQNMCSDCHDELWLNLARAGPTELAAAASCFQLQGDVPPLLIGQLQADGSSHDTRMWSKVSPRTPVPSEPAALCAARSCEECALLAEL